MGLQEHELKALAIELAAAIPPVERTNCARFEPSISIEGIDLIGERLRQALGIIGLMRSCGDGNADVSPLTLSSAAWAAETALSEALRMLEAR